GSGLALAIAADGRYVAEIRADGIACWLSAEDWRAATPLPVTSAKEVAFDGEGRFLLVSGDGRIDLFDRAAGFAHRLGCDDVACACFAESSQLWRVDRAGSLCRYTVPE